MSKLDRLFELDYGNIPTRARQLSLISIDEYFKARATFIPSTLRRQKRINFRGRFDGYLWFQEPLGQLPEHFTVYSIYVTVLSFKNSSMPHCALNRPCQLVSKDEYVAHHRLKTNPARLLNTTMRQH